MKEAMKNQRRFSDAIYLVELAGRGLAPMEEDAWAFVAACRGISVDELDDMTVRHRRKGREGVDVLCEADEYYQMIGKAMVAKAAIDIQDVWMNLGGLPDPYE